MVPARKQKGATPSCLGKTPPCGKFIIRAITANHGIHRRPCDGPLGLAKRLAPAIVTGPVEMQDASPKPQNCIRKQRLEPVQASSRHEDQTCRRRSKHEEHETRARSKKRNATE